MTGSIVNSAPTEIERSLKPVPGLGAMAAQEGVGKRVVEASKTPTATNRAERDLI